MVLSLEYNMLLLLLPLLLFFWCVLATPELVIEHDDRAIIDVAEFGFLPGGRLTLTVNDYKVGSKSSSREVKKKKRAKSVCLVG
jgi:hypothetical protein